MINTQSVSSNHATAQASTSAPLNHPKLRLHHDGRVSFQDTNGHWTRFANEIPAELVSQAPERQRQRLGNPANLNGNGGKVVLVRVVNNKPHRAECPLCKASSRRTVAKVASGKVVTYRECACGWHGASRTYIQRPLVQMEFAFMAGGQNGVQTTKQ
jgi:hypothetical protein